MGISIHALREEGDGRLRYFGHQAEIISIHALREEGDLGSPWVSVGFSEFLSTPSARRATDTFLIFCRQMQISIHALREEGDGQAASGADSGCDFYPRPPRGGRPARAEKADSREAISIHALREEGDYTVQIVHVGAVISIHALREEGDGSFSQFILDLDTFLSTPSARRATNGSSRCRPA